MLYGYGTQKSMPQEEKKIHIEIIIIIVLMNIKPTQKKAMTKY